MHHSDYFEKVEKSWSYDSFGSDEHIRIKLQEEAVYTTKLYFKINFEVLSVMRNN